MLLFIALNETHRGEHRVLRDVCEFVCASMHVLHEKAPENYPDVEA